MPCPAWRHITKGKSTGVTHDWRHTDTKLTANLSGIADFKTCLLIVSHSVSVKCSVKYRR